MKPKVECAIAVSLVSAAYLPAFAEGDPARGESTFQRCASCHAIGEDARRLSGPTLNGLPGALVAYDEEYRYSPALRALREDGVAWTADNLDAFLASPREFAPGNRMPFAGLRDQQDRADMIAYISQFAGTQ